MIGQYLPNNNENVTVTFCKKKLASKRCLYVNGVVVEGKMPKAVSGRGGPYVRVVWPIYIYIYIYIYINVASVPQSCIVCSSSRKIIQSLEMQTTACVGLAFKGSHHHHRKGAGASAAAPPVLIGGVLESKLVLARRLPCFSWSHRVRTWAIGNVSNFEPSVWGDFFLTYSSPLASSPQPVCF
jgi:hypothetical protein